MGGEEGFGQGEEEGEEAEVENVSCSPHKVQSDRKGGRGATEAEQAGEADIVQRAVLKGSKICD